MRLFKIAILPSKVRPVGFQKNKDSLQFRTAYVKVQSKNLVFMAFGLSRNGQAKVLYSIIRPLQTKVRQRLFLPMFSLSYIKGFKFIPVNDAARKYTEWNTV